MKYEVFYSIGDYKDSIVIEGETEEDVRSNTAKELNLRNAKYLYADWLENS